jgi:hypothetical protein
VIKKAMSKTFASVEISTETPTLSNNLGPSENNTPGFSYIADVDLQQLWQDKCIQAIEELINPRRTECVLI